MGLKIDTLLNENYRNTGMLGPIGKIPVYSLRSKNCLKISCGSSAVAGSVFWFAL